MNTHAYVWGYNNNGALGLGHTATVYSPAPAQLPKDLADVQGGANFTIALTRSGEVFGWGDNTHGQLGNGTTRGSLEAVSVPLPKGARAAAIAVGTDHVLALTRHSEIYAWGRNHRGQIGIGNAQDVVTKPQLVHLDGNDTVVALGAGHGVSAAVTSRGKLFTWGRNGSGQLAVSSHGADVAEPTRAMLPHGTKVVAVDAGYRHLLALTHRGEVLQFGVDAQGRPLASTVPLDTEWGKVTAISAGEEFAVALTSEHTVIAWGANGAGQLGQADVAFRSSPRVVKFPSAKGRVTAVQAGVRNVVALTSADEVYTWGETRFGQGAVGVTTRNNGRPKRLTSLTGVRAAGLHVGDNHTILRTSRGPAARLTLTPERTTVRPGETVTYRVHALDAFGTDLGPARDVLDAPVHLKITHGDAVGQTVRAHRPGGHHVTARCGHVAGFATLFVKNGK